MDIFTTILLVLAVLLSLYNLLAIRSVKKQISDAKDGFQNSIAWNKEDLRNDMNGIRTVVNILASGGKVTKDMVEEGKPFSDVAAVEVAKMLNEPNQAVVIDVRTQSEYLSGHIPGSKLIPVDEIENRFTEVPREANPILVVCQGGGRSAAACEILSEKGFINLVNIHDGMGAWPGKKEIGVPIRPPEKH
jgi:rhodanese-related sulfurtransferase